MGIKDGTKISLPKRPLRFIPTTKPSDKNVGSGNDEEEIIILSSNMTMLQSLANFDLTKLEDDLSIAEGRREKAYAQSRLIERKIRILRAFLIRSGTASEVDEAMSSLMTLFADTIIDSEEDVGNSALINAPRKGNLGLVLQNVVQVHAYFHFLKTGMLIQQSECMCYSPEKDITITFRDEEYLAGIIAFTHDLAGYGVGRAILRDPGSVEIAKEVVAQLMDSLLRFDFRSGTLRRMYDGTKFALRKLETILYELSITEARIAMSSHVGSIASSRQQDETSEPAPKRTRFEVDSEAATANSSINKFRDPNAAAVVRVNEAELEQIRKRMEDRVDMQETIIKRCRDSQRFARRAIYALHHKEKIPVDKLVLQCENIAEELLPMIQKEPGLRYGSFADALEEYAQAKLFAIWLREQRLGTPNDILLVNNEEYLSALCNLTGEIVKYAIVQGTRRNADAVKLCLATNQQILTTVLAIVDLPGALAKKMEALKNNVEKLEQILYEISLIQSGRCVPTEILYENDSVE